MSGRLPIAAAADTVKRPDKLLAEGPLPLLPVGQQGLGKKRIRINPRAQRGGESRGEQRNGDDDEERQLESRRKELLRVPAQEKQRGGSKTVEQIRAAMQPDADEQHGEHDGRTNGGWPQTGHERVAERPR